MDEMTKEEMQRFLIMEHQRGATEIEMLRNFIRLLGLTIPKDDDQNETKEN